MTVRIRAGGRPVLGPGVIGWLAARPPGRDHGIDRTKEAESDACRTMLLSG